MALSRNYRLIVAPRKFDVLKTNMLALRTSNFQGATIRLIDITTTFSSARQFKNHIELFSTFLDESRLIENEQKKINLIQFQLFIF